MALTRVRVNVNGVWTICTRNSSTGRYEADVTAPSTTSHNLPGGYYPVTVEATNDAGTVTTKDSTDGTLGSSLRLVVKEKVKPVIKLESPTDGAYLQNNKTPITFTVTDEAGGSGVNLSSVVLKVDSAAVTPTRTAVTNGYRYTYTPSGTWADGKHSIAITAGDNDGNTANAVNASITIDTVPPNLMLTSPQNGLIINRPACTLSGTTNDASSSPVAVAVTLNGVSAGTATVAADGSFTKSLTLKEGSNSIKVTSTDKAGRSTSVTLSVKLDTTVPEIRSVRFEPNPADASASVRISLEVY